MMVMLRQCMLHSAFERLLSRLISKPPFDAVPAAIPPHIALLQSLSSIHSTSSFQSYIVGNEVTFSSSDLVLTGLASTDITVVPFRMVQSLAACFFLLAATNAAASPVTKRDNSCMIYHGNMKGKEIGTNKSLSTDNILAPNSHWIDKASNAYSADWSVGSQLLTLNAQSNTAATFNVFVVSTSVSSFKYTLNKGDMCQVLLPKAPLDTVQSISVVQLTTY
jgi:hypothetical protein